MSGSASTPIANLPPWLDRDTGALIEDMIVTLSTRRPDLIAVILYGSIARQDERPLDDPSPSDVDVLAVFDTDDERFAIREGKELFRHLGVSYNRHLSAKRDVKVMFASRTLSEWDSSFTANIARDGILLWTRGQLPAALRSVAEPTQRTGRSG